MAETLRSRLARARELSRIARESPSDPEPLVEEPDAAASEPSGQLSGWTRAAPFVFSRVVRRDNPLPEFLDLRPYLPGTLRPADPERERSFLETGSQLRLFRADRLLFLDLETTGLSGGAGTVAFLAGLGRVVPGYAAEGFEIRQFLLTDYPGEGAFLDAVLGELSPGTVLASYNGRSFDEPLLRTRCVLNRKDWPRHLHADFLPPARRLWRKRFPDCSLGTLETLLLGRCRTLDVPGSRIPEIWFEYVKRGFHPLLGAVLEHNAADLESLAAVAAECGRAHANPAEARGCDRTALGALWLKLDPGMGRAALEGAFAEGEERAGWLLLGHYRRERAYGEYERILTALIPSRDSWVEKAKHEEHRSRNPEAALRAALEAQSFPADSEFQESLERRIRRLERKLAAIRSREGRTSLPR